MSTESHRAPGNYPKVFIFFASLLLFDIYGLIIFYNFLIEFLYHIPRFMYGSPFEHSIVVTVLGGQFNYIYYKIWLFLNLFLGNIVAFLVIRTLNAKKIIIPWIRDETHPETFFAQVILSNILINFVVAILLILFVGTKLFGTCYLVIFFMCGYLSAVSIYFIHVLRHHPDILSYRVSW